MPKVARLFSVIMLCVPIVYKNGENPGIFQPSIDPVLTLLEFMLCLGNLNVCVCSFNIILNK